MAESLFRIAPNLPAVLDARIQARVNRAIERVWVALQRWAQEWSRRAARVTPVGETGTLRRSYFVIPVRRGTVFTVILANHMEYGRWLEFGTRFIANGRILAWQQGQTPVMMWPAKERDLQGGYLNRDEKGRYLKKSERTADRVEELRRKFLEKATTIGSGEQMPMVRPTGYDLIPQIIADVQKIIQDELGRAA